MTAAPPRFAAIVLAAGRSSRMGRLKPLLPFGPTSVLAHVVDTLRLGGVDEIRVVVGHRADELLPAVTALGVDPVVNVDYDRGMFSSIRAGLEALPDDVAGTLLLPVDVPLVRPSTVAALLAAGRTTDAAVLHPTFRGERGHPPLLARRLFSAVLAHDGEGGLATLLAARPDDAAELAVCDRGILHDMDRPDDYARLAEALPHRRHPEPIECEAILDAAAVGDPVRRHARAVAALAVDLAERLVASGLALDVDLVRAGALLHDVAKGHPRHAEAGAELVAALGFAPVAAVIARHMDLGRADPPLDETSLVHLADKLVREDRRVGLDERFAAAFHRFRDDPAALAGARRRRDAAEAVLQAVRARIDFADAAADAPVPTDVRGEARISR